MSNPRCAGLVGMLVAICLAGCGTTGPGDDPFVDDCNGGSGAECGQLTLRWTVDRLGEPSTCASVGADSVTLSGVFQADGRTATYESSCNTGAILTTKLPLGPYALGVVLVDAAGRTLDTQTTLTTLGVAGTVTEAYVTFDVTPVVVAGGTFGECGASSPCTDPTQNCVPLANGKHYCSPACSPFPSTVCEAAVVDLGGNPSATSCIAFNGETPWCVLMCDGNAGPCPPGLTCQDDPVLGRTCQP